MTIRDVTYTNDLCRLELKKSVGSSATDIGTTRLAGTPTSLNESNYGSSLSYDLSSSKRIDSTLTFTRASTATYFDSNGYLTNASINEPRFNHDPYTKKSLGLLIEPDTSNAYTGNDATGGVGAFSTSAGISPATGTVTDPRNISSTQSRFQINTVTNTSHYGTYTIFNNTDKRVASIFLKHNSAAGVIYPVIIIDDGGGNGCWVSFDLVNGVVLQTGTNGICLLLEYGMQKLPNGWYRCWVGGSKNGLVSWARVGITATNTTTGSQWYPSYAGSIGDSFWMYGLQLEHSTVASSPSSFMLGVTTRSRDICFVNSNHFRTYHNNEEGTLLCEFNHPLQGSLYPFKICGTTSSIVPIMAIVEENATSVITDIQYDTACIIINNITGTDVAHFYRGTDTSNNSAASITQSSTTLNKVALCYSASNTPEKPKNRSISINGTLAAIGSADICGIMRLTNPVLLIGGEKGTQNNAAGFCISKVSYYPRSLAFQSNSLATMTVGREF